jgi:hypothetical protein
MSDVFDRLKKKARPTVPARDTTLVKAQNDELSNDQFTEVSQSVNDENMNLLNTEKINDHFVPLNKEQELGVPQIIRRTIRLEQSVDNKLGTLCNGEKITRDTFLEAAFVVCSEKEELMQEILEEAKKRYYQRKQVGEQRKFQTMAKRISGAEPS